VLKFGGEKVLTKHLPDECVSKLHVSLEDTDKLVENNVKILDGNHLGIRGTSVTPPIPSINKATIDPIIIKTRAKMGSFKTRLEKIMHKLYDLEPDNAPEKPLNVDLGLDLYQMENF
jgi:hypothetical protein